MLPGVCFQRSADKAAALQGPGALINSCCKVLQHPWVKGRESCKVFLLGLPPAGICTALPPWFCYCLVKNQVIGHNPSSFPSQDVGQLIKTQHASFKQQLPLSDAVL